MKNKKINNVKLVLIFLFLTSVTFSQEKFNGLAVDMGNLHRLSDAKTRSITPENRTGEKGKGGMATLETGSAKYAARELGQKWKVNPYLNVKENETVVLAEIDGPGAIQHIWITQAGRNFRDLRSSILRFYWDGETTPSVEVPLGDFFGIGWNSPHVINSLPVCVGSMQAFNSYWTMPFREKCKITLENRGDALSQIYYQVDYALGKVEKDAAYFHAQFRRVKQVPYKQDYVIVDGIKGKGHYVGCTMAWETKDTRWWGEGEVKFFMDGDTEFPTICGTGTEDYFGGSHCYVEEWKSNMDEAVYKDFSSLYAGFYLVKGAFNKPLSRFDMYRWHVTDPVRFESDLKITVQALGWKENGAYKVLEDDIASVCFWYQTEPHAPFPQLPGKEILKIDTP